MYTKTIIEYLTYKRIDDLGMIRCSGVRRLVVAAYKGLLYLRTNYKDLDGDQAERILMLARHPVEAIHRAELLLDTDSVP